MTIKLPAKYDPAALFSRNGNTKNILKYARNERLFVQGDTADAVFFIKKGQVKLAVVSTAGKDAVVAVLNAGEFCGEGCLAGQVFRMATAIAMVDCELIRLERSAFSLLLKTEPAFSEFFVTYLLTRTIRVEEDLIDQLFNSSEKRLARTLMLLANFGIDGGSSAVVAKVSQETLAEMIGTTRSRVSFFMNKFRRLGFISYGETLEVHPSLLSVIVYDRNRQDSTVQ
jgi:CRP/FNR family cyclic AMP-dependent transcriptional regulator